jgi:translocation and assembly module TamB
MNWKKTAGWTGAVLAALFVVLLVGGYIVLKTPWFHQYVLAKIAEEGRAGTGGTLNVQAWDVHFFPLKVDLYGVVLRGTEPRESKPLLQADKLTVGVNFQALLARKLQLSEILIQHPVVDVRVDLRGKNNLPTPPPKPASNTTIWTLAIGHTVLNDSAIYYNNVETPLTADLYDLHSEIRFDSAATRYSGSISYRDGRLQYANYAALPHSLEARFSATASVATLSSLLLKVGSSRILLRGEMEDYSRPKVSATYEIQLHPQDFATLSPGLRPAGDFDVAGDFHYTDLPNQPFLRNISVNGSIASSELQVASAQGQLELRDLKGQYRLASGDLEIHDVAANAIGGQLAAELAIKRLGTTPEGTIRASLSHLSIEAAKQSIALADIRHMPVTGTVDAQLNGSWSGSVKNIRLLGDVRLRAAAWNNSSISRSATPVDGNAHLVYDGPHDVVTLHQTTLRIPSTSVVLDGEVGSRVNLRVQAIAGDLHQLAALASSLQTSSSSSESQPIDVSGTAKLDAIVQGSIQNPRISGQLSAQDLEVQGSRWKSAQLVLQANPSQFTVKQAVLVSAQQGSLNFSAQVGLKKWSYLASSPIRANLSAKKLSLEELEHLANRQYPVAGTLSANVSFHGSQLHPAGGGSLEIANASAYDQPIQTLKVQFQAANDSIHSLANVLLPAGSVSLTLAYTPKTKAYKVNLQTPGIVVQDLQAVQAKDLPLSGTLMATASGAGTLDNPQLNLSLQIPTLQVRQTAITQMQAQLTVQNQRANLALSTSIAPAFIRANATVDLTGDYDAQATIDTNKVPLDPFLEVYAPGMPAGFHGETELHASLRGPLKARSQLEAHLRIPTLSGSYQSIQFSNVGPIRADYAHSVLVLAPGEIRGTETSLTFQARVPIQNSAAMNLQAKGNVNLKMLSLFSSDIKSSGSVDLDINGAGTIGHPSLQGNIQVKDAALSTSAAPVGLSKVNGTMDIAKDRITIKSLTGELGGGNISASGAIVYSPNLQFNVALQGKSIRLLYPQGVRTLLDSNLTFTGNMQAANLSGRALIDSLNFTPDFDLSSFSGQFNGISVPPTGESFSDHIKLAVLVQSTQNLSARSQQLSLQGIANLQLTGTVSDPVIVGRVDLTSAELFFLNNRYTLQRGIITFDDPNQTNPVLNVQVSTTIEQYHLTLTLTGPLNRLNTSYVSDPAISEADIINLVYQGQTVEEAEGAGTSTDSFLAGQAAGKFTNTVQKLAGISSLQIDPLIGGNNVNPSARIALQQRVTKNFLFTFSTDVTQPNQQIVQGEYQINKRWSVSVVRDELGGVGVDARLRTKF